MYQQITTCAKMTKGIRSFALKGYTDTLSGMALIASMENKDQILATTSVLAQVASGIDGGSVSTVAVGLQGRQAASTIFKVYFSL